MTDTTLMTTDTSTDDVASQTAEDVAAAEAAAAENAQQTAAEDVDKVEGDKPEDDAGEQDKPEDDKEDDAPKGAPEAYEDFAVPEGVELDTEVLGKFKDVAKELNLPQEAAQKVTDLAVELAQKWGSEQTERVAEMQSGWKAEAEADKEIGGDALSANLAVAKTALDKFGTPALSELLDASGLGNHPEIVRAFFKVGKAISEDTFVAGGTASPSASAAKTLFPNMN